MAKTASTPGRRFMKLAGMTASIAGKTLSNSIKNLTADEEQKNTARSKLFQDIGIQIADTLGEMKGAVMKVGQIASQYKDIFHPKLPKPLPNCNVRHRPCHLRTFRRKLKRNSVNLYSNYFNSLMNSLCRSIDWSGT